jgi:hypothetical protein
VSTFPRIVQITDMNFFVSGALEATDVLHLFQTPLTVGPLTALADLLAAECDFPGYVALATSGIYVVGIDPIGNSIAKYGASLIFEAGVLVTTETAGGWFLTNATHTMLKGAANFASPFSFANDGDTLLMQHFINVLWQGDADTEFVSGA